MAKNKPLTGKYSFNLKDGDRCYGCGGKGKILPRLTPALVAEVKAKVDGGALDAYLAEQARLVACRKAIAPVKEAIDETWRNGAIHTAYRAAYDARYVKHTTDSIDAALSDYVSKVNALWDSANDKARNTKAYADKLLAELQGILAAIEGLNAEYAARG